MQGHVRRTVGIRGSDERRNSGHGHVVGCDELRSERAELDLGAEMPHGIDRRHDVATRVSLDEWFDREFDS